jgi:hypothetical protein
MGFGEGGNFQVSLFHYWILECETRHHLTQ